MAKILITPEYVRKLGSDFKRVAQENLMRITKLNRQIEDLRAQWEGVTREKFYADFERARATMKAYSPMLDGIGTELDRIGQRFAEADQQAVARAANTKEASSKVAEALDRAAAGSSKQAPDQAADAAKQAMADNLKQAMGAPAAPAPDQAASTAPSPDTTASTALAADQAASATAAPDQAAASPAPDQAATTAPAADTAASAAPSADQAQAETTAPAADQTTSPAPETASTATQVVGKTSEGADIYQDTQGNHYTVTSEYIPAGTDPYNMFPGAETSPGGVFEVKKPYTDT